MLEACKKTVMALTTRCNSSLHAEVESLAALWQRCAACSEKPQMCNEAGNLCTYRNITGQQECETKITSP